MINDNIPTPAPSFFDRVFSNESAKKGQPPPLPASSSP